jgi:hypothetical protein
LRHEIRPWNSIDAETAERVRNPESGTGVGADSLLHKGAKSRMPLKGAETQRKVGSGT